MALTGVPFTHAQASSPGSPAIETAAQTEMLPDPQLVIWTDPVSDYIGSVAHNPAHDEFMVGWTIVQDQWSRDVWARRLRPDGTLLEFFNVANAAGEMMEGPEIEYCPLQDEYLMAFTNWYDGSGDRADVQARRVAWDGGWMSEVFTISPEVAMHYYPSIAYRGACDEYVVTYSNQWPGYEHDLYAQRVRAFDGALLGMNCVASGGGWTRDFSQVSFHPGMYGGAGGYLIAYLAIAETPSTDWKVRYKTSHTELYDLFANPELDVSSTTSALLAGPRVAAGEAGFLVAWWESNASGFQVRARRIGADGVALGPPEGFAVSGAYAWAPTGFPVIGVTYAYPGLYLAFWEYETPSTYMEIHGVFVSEDADTTVGGEVVLTGTGGWVRQPAAICSPVSDCLIAYEWWNTQTNSGDIGGDIARLVVIFENGFESGDTSAWSAMVP